MRSPLQAIKALLFPGRGGSGGGLFGWGRFNKLTDPWPRSTGSYTLSTLGGGSISVPAGWQDYAPPAIRIPQVAACVASVLRIFPDAPLQVAVRTADGDEEPVPEHPLRLLLDNPNPWYAENTLWQGTLCDYLLDGNAFWHVESDRTGTPIRLDYLPRCLVEPRWPDQETTTTFISHYIYKVGSTEVRLEPEEIIHFRWGFDPENLRLGWSPLKSATLELALLWAGSLYGWGILKNFGAIAGILMNLEDDTSGFTDDVANRLREQFRQLFTGGGAGTIMVPTFKSEYQELGQSPEKMALDTLLARPEDIICALLGLSPMFVGLTSGSQHKTYANYQESEKAAWAKCVKPLKRDLGGDLAKQILSRFRSSKGQLIGWDFSDVSVLQPDLDSIWERVGKAQERGIITKDEARGELGFAELTPEQQEELTPEPPPEAPGGMPESRGDRQAQLNGNGTAGKAAGSQPRVPAGSPQGGQFAPRAGYRLGTEADRERFGISRNFVNIEVNENPRPGQAYGAFGHTEAGEARGFYSQEHIVAQLAEKHARGREFDRQLPAITRRLTEDMQPGGRHSEEAGVLYTQKVMGFRVGGEGAGTRDRATGETVPTFGAATLRKEHVRVEGDTVHFDFPGKGNERQQHSSSDPQLVGMLRERTAREGTERIFQTRETRVRDYLEEIAPGSGFIPHDFRTWNATSTARHLVTGMSEPPRTARELSQMRNQVADVVAAKLGDKRATVLKNYIDPAIFAPWEAALSE